MHLSDGESDVGSDVDLKRAYMGNICMRVSFGLMGSLLMCGPVMAQSQKIGDPPEFSNTRLVGFNDLQGRSAYQPTIHRQGDRWIAYIGHHGGHRHGAEAGQFAHRATGVQRNFDPRRYRSGTSEVSRPYSGPGRDL